ncbi:hypothetical protein AB0L57_31195 [Nocardia sp. NPDC052254]|uniref:hypothetical protein n=1 Tax=Nocardia sp. NPDC052254 TaxID=3155681 RepID=UPI00341CD745
MTPEEELTEMMAEFAKIHEGLNTLGACLGDLNSGILGQLDEVGRKLDQLATDPASGPDFDSVESKIDEVLSLVREQNSDLGR